MRIEAYSQIQQIYKPQTTKKVNQSAYTQSFSDNLQISSMGKDIQTAKQAVANTPDVRTDLTASIKDSIDNGTYSVSSDSFADKLLEKLQASLV